MTTKVLWADGTESIMIDVFGETYNRRTLEPIWIGFWITSIFKVENDPKLTMENSESGGCIIDEHLLH
jgi:hypothetical protein